MVANLVEPFISLDACKNKELPSTYPVQIFLKQESGETEDKKSQKMLVKEPRGVFLCSEGFESTK